MDTYLRVDEEVVGLNLMLDREFNFKGSQIVDSTSKVLKNIGNGVIDFFKKFRGEAVLDKSKKERVQNEERTLNFNSDTKQKSNSFFSKLKTVTIDKFRSFRYNLNAKYYLWKMEKQKQIRIESIKGPDIFEEEYKENKEANTENNDGLELNPKSKSTTNSFASRIGRVSNSLLRKLHLENIDLKIKNAFESAQIFILSKWKNVRNVRRKVLNFKSEQIVKYYEWRAKKQLEKEQKRINESYKGPDIFEEEARKARTKQHKESMTSLLSAQERQIQLEKYNALLKQKKELLQSFNNKNNSIEDSEDIKKSNGYRKM